MKNISVLFSMLCLCASISFGANTITPGALSAPYPTIINIGILWKVTGDDNRTARVAVEYRKTGTEVTYHPAMDLQHASPGHSGGYENSDDAQGGTWENRFAGSIFDLRPNTNYDVHLVMTDPDNGGAWSKDTTITVKTRPVPRADASCNITELAPGVHGALTVTSGTASRPNVYRCLTGRATYSGVNLLDMSYVYLMNITFKSDNTSNVYGLVYMRGTNNCVVQRCTLDITGTPVAGITSYVSESRHFGSRNLYIADNVIIGPHPFTAANLGPSGNNSVEGVQLTGNGNVVCYNYVKAFRDDIGTLEEIDSVASMDVYNNDLYDGCDDGIEMDGTNFNCRILRNRVTNTFVALSSQPARGGPSYFIRNVVYNNTFVSTKLNNRSSGNYWLHNTVVKLGDGLVCQDAWWIDNGIFRNNLGFGGVNTQGTDWGGYDPGTGMGMSYYVDTLCSLDYDAVGSYGVTFATSVCVEHTLGGWRDWTDIQHVEAHCVTNLNFASVFPGVQFPDIPIPAFSTAPDLRPASGSAVVDKGQALANVNDGFTGTAPDCGAYEAGQALPWYGPRAAGIDEESDTANIAVLPATVMKNTVQSLKVSPNPFSSRTTLSFAMPKKSGEINVSVFSVSGKKVKTIYTGAATSTQKSFSWDGSADDGRPLSKGVYLVQLKTEGTQYIERVMLIR